MKKACPICCQHFFKYKELLSVTPQPLQFTPASLDCPRCKAKIGSTVFSKFICGVILISSLMGGMIGLATFFPDLSKLEIIVFTIVVLALNYRIFWPAVIRLKKWETLEDTLPKSRTSGYLLYLVLPVAVIIGLFTMAVAFKWGV